MPTLLNVNPIQEAVRACVPTLQRMAAYELDPALDRRMQDLGERKELLQPDEYTELLALVRFTQQRTLEKLEAAAAVKRLQAVAPDLMGVP